MRVEALAWIGVGVLSILLRFVALDRAPLNEAEAGQAMLAWRAATGSGMPSAGSYSPLLFWGNGLVFWLFGGADGAARFVPAVLGVGLVLSPMLLRRELGRIGALAAGFYMAISPAAVLASRQVDGWTGVALGSLLVLGGAARFWETKRSGWLLLSGIGVALSVTAGPWAVGILGVMVLAAVGLAWVRAGGELGSVWRDVRPHLWAAAGTLALGFLVLATGLGWNGDGISAAGGMLVGWLRTFREVPASPVAFPLTLLLVYEPLALLLAAGAVGVAVRKGDRFAHFVAGWVGLAALLAVAVAGRRPIDVLIVVVPLALLAGRGIDWLVSGLQEQGRLLHEGLLAAGLLLLSGHLYLVLARYSEVSALQEIALYAALAVLAVLLAASAIAAVGALVGVGAAIRGAALGLGVALLVYTLSAGWGVAHVRPDDPRELLVERPTPVNVRDLVETVQGLSWQETGSETSTPLVTDVAADSVVAWYLKDYRAADWASSVAAAADGYDVLVSQNSALGAAEAVFVGQDFPILTTWDPGTLRCELSWPPACRTVVKWLLLRRTEAAPAVEEVAVVWARKDLVVIEVAE
jgi:uncharacterized protein (TIGR03663 family)